MFRSKIAPGIHHARRRRRPALRGFTLAEVLVATGILVLLVVLMLQLLSGTSATIAASNKHLDSDALARIVLDRFDVDFSGAILGGGATAIYYSESGSAGNSAIGFASKSRARGPTTQTQPWTTDTRSAFVGYRVRSVVQYIDGATSSSLPCLNRGDGRFTFSTSDITNLASYNLWDVFGTGNTRIPNDLTASTNDQKVLNWQILANGIFRLHISFVLDDGRIVQTPPSYKNFYVNGGAGLCTPITFSKLTSADSNQRFVKGLIVGVAVLDERTRNLAYRVDNNFDVTIGNQMGRPINDGESPADIWRQNLPNITFRPVRESLRLYQRFYSVSL